MNIKDLLGKKTLFFDGGMGTMLQKNGLKSGEIPELLNLNKPDLITSIHKEYLEAGADIITTNTFGANPIKAAELGDSLEFVIAAGIGNARKACNEYSTEDKPRFVAFDIGPTGKLM